MAAQKRRINVYGMGQGGEYGGITKSDLSPTELTNLLAEANGFDLSYLSENSRGELAPGQARLLVRHLTGPVIIALVTLGILVYQLYSGGYFNQLAMGTPLGALFSDMPQGLKVVGGVLLGALIIPKSCSFCRTSSAPAYCMSYSLSVLRSC